MSPKQRFAGRDGEESREEVGREPRLKDDERAVNAGPAKVGRVLGQVGGSEPLHHPVVRPQSHLLRRIGGDLKFRF